MHAMDRAVLQSRIDTARMLHRMAGSPTPPEGALGSPAYTLSVSGTAFLFEIGADVHDYEGQPGKPVEVVLGPTAASPQAKHRILEMYVEHGLEFPDTPMMALHRGRIDLLEKHLARDPRLLDPTFRFAEIFPPEVGCDQPAPYEDFLPRTPLPGPRCCTSRWSSTSSRSRAGCSIAGMDPDESAAIDANGFGGHTALFNAVVSYPNFWMNFGGGWPGTRKPTQADFAELLLEHGADPNARASFRYRLDAPEGRIDREVRDITPLQWGAVFHNRMIVSEPALQAIAARAGSPNRPE